MVIHKKCHVCGKIGYKSEMTREVWSQARYWFHRKCYMEWQKVKKCPCGKGWVKC